MNNAKLTKLIAVALLATQLSAFAMEQGKSLSQEVRHEILGNIDPESALYKALNQQAEQPQSSEDEQEQIEPNDEESEGLSLAAVQEILKNLTPGSSMYKYYKQLENELRTK